MVRPKKDAAAPPKKRGRPPKNKAAEAPKPEAQPQPLTESASGSTLKLPAAGTISTLIKRLESMAKDAGDITKSKRDLIAKAEETKHVDKVALGWALSLLKKYKKKPAQFGVSFNHFLAYLDDLGLPKLADEALGMDLGEGVEAEQLDLEGAISDAPPARTGLSIVPGPNAPSEVPAAPEGESEAA